MKSMLLILTPSSELGELINQALRETDQYDVFNIADMQLATTLLEDHPECKHVMLDTSLGDIEVIELSHIMRMNNPDINIILVAKGDVSPEFAEILPWKLLHKPFLSQDLLAVLESSQPMVVDLEAIVRTGEENFAGLNDPYLAGQILEQLTTASEVQEAIIFRNHDIWARAGHLKRDAIEEISHMLGNNMDFGKNDDLLRYVLITATQQQHGVYAIKLAFNAMLAVIFDLRTPVSRMRMQADALAEALSDRLVTAGEKRSSSSLPPGIDLPAPTQSEEQLNLAATPGGWQLKPPDDFMVGRGRFNDPSVQPLGDNFVAYSCLLTPRFETHQLAGDVADLLSEKFPQICISYGWRLGFFAVNMNCLHWVVKLPPDISPADHIETVRGKTSDYIFAEYAGYLAENVSGDFWAPGFSVIDSMQHHTPEQILTFVQKSRISSGVYRL